MASSNAAIQKIIQHIPLPRMIKVRQKFCQEHIADIPAALHQQLGMRNLPDRIVPGATIAITAGSRGIANLPEILRELVGWVKAHDGQPFIVPTMGSHGGATAEGQTGVLRELGITEETVGAPIRATMEVVRIGTTPSGLPVHIDRFAQEADAIIVVGRIKQHTSFRAPIESGLAKMIAVGLGKRDGAETCHAAGVPSVPLRVREIAETALNRANILFAVGILENAYDETFRIAAIPAEHILTEEPALLDISREHMPQVLFAGCDALVVDAAGKNIAGTGMDPNVIRRNYIDTFVMPPLAQRLALLSLTEESHGNANGMTNADVCTRRFFNQIDFFETYPNPLTNGMLQSCKIPLVMENDRLAIQAAIKGCYGIDHNDARLIRIKNTLQIGEIMISENLLPEARNNPRIDIISAAEELAFDARGNLF